MTGDLQLLNVFRRKKAKKHNVPNGNTNGNGAVDNATWNSIMNNENPSGIDYQASSPDEKALVEAADRFGVTFLGEEGNNLLVRTGDHTEMFERLQIIEFTSERKRMSVIVKDKDGKVSFIFISLSLTSTITLYLIVSCKTSIVGNRISSHNFAAQRLQKQGCIHRTSFHIGKHLLTFFKSLTLLKNSLIVTTTNLFFEQCATFYHLRLANH